MYDLWLKIAKDKAATANYVERAPYEVPERLAQSGRPRALGALIIVLSFCGYLAWLGGPGPYIGGLIAILDLGVMFGMFFGLRPERLPDPKQTALRQPDRATPPLTVDAAQQDAAVRTSSRASEASRASLCPAVSSSLARHLEARPAEVPGARRSAAGGCPRARGEAADAVAPTGRTGSPRSAAASRSPSSTTATACRSRRRWTTHFAAEGADHVLLFTEYSPKATGIQPIEDVLPLVEQQPGPLPPGRQHQPASALPGEGRAGPPGRALAPSHARSIRCTAASSRPTGCSIPPTHGARNGACRSSCTAAPRRSRGRSTPSARRRCSTRCSATSPTSPSCSPMAAAAGGTTRRPSWR